MITIAKVYKCVAKKAFFRTINFIFPRFTELVEILILKETKFQLWIQNIVHFGSVMQWALVKKWLKSNFVIRNPETKKLLLLFSEAKVVELLLPWSLKFVIKYNWIKSSKLLSWLLQKVTNYSNQTTFTELHQ